MMQTFTAPMLNDRQGFYRSRGMVLFELLVVIVMLALFVGLAMWNFGGLFSRNRFKSQVNELMSMFSMAITAASENGRKYEIIIDVAEQTYLLREITSSDLSEVLDEQIMHKARLNEDCRILYVQFDDLVTADESEEGNIAKFRAGRVGWQYGGKIVLVDAEGNEYTVLINRLNRTVELAKGDVELLVPVDGAELAL
ncbi:MAG: hypothetical protein ABIG61_08385 [Planctomycetota bacterium]